MQITIKSANDFIDADEIDIFIPGSSTATVIDIPLIIGSGGSGSVGPAGPKGDKGDTGDQGPAGADGRDGIDGVDGAQGPKGDKGDKGDQGQNIQVVGFDDKAAFDAYTVPANEIAIYYGP